MMKTHNIVLVITIIYFLLVGILSGFGPLTFGAGLGDLAYLFLILLWVIILLGYYIIIRIKKVIFKPLISIFLTLIFITSIFLITLKFTYLRDGLYPWNGRLHLISHEEFLEIEKKQMLSEIDSLERMVVVNPHDYELLTKQGYLHSEMKNWDKAISKFNKALETNPNYFDALFGLGDCYCSKHQFNEAQEAFEKAKLIDSTRNHIIHRIDILKNR